MLSFSFRNRRYVRVSVSATIAGTAHDPSGDAVAFAFLADPNADPDDSDWHAGNWDTGVGGTHLAQCLVGPGATALAIGSYSIWVQIDDDPEHIEERVGLLRIT